MWFTHKEFGLTEQEWQDAEELAERRRNQEDWDSDHD
jgi:hypothetical protein